MGRHFSDLKHKWNNKSAGQKTTMAHKVFRNEVLDTGVGTSDPSAGEEDLRESSPRRRIMYSYDATHGPGSGTDVLSNAVTKAVQRYENKVTEKLAKEYEFVDNTKELADGYTTDAEEDDFEIIDGTNLETHDARTLYGGRWTLIDGVWEWSLKLFSPALITFSITQRGLSVKKWILRETSKYVTVSAILLDISR
jgi:hypothetical protein